MVALIGGFAMGSGPTAATTKESGLWGGGFENVISSDPSAPTTSLLVGTDIGGLFRSTDGGETWLPSNASASGAWAADDERHIASVGYLDSLTVYAAFGNAGASKGGIKKSADGGQTWTRLTPPPGVTFNGEASGRGGPFGDVGEPVRSTGNLMAFDTGRGLGYVGTWNQGVYRFNVINGAWTLDPIALGPGDCGTSLTYTTCYIRTLVADPNDPTHLFVGTFGDGAFEIVNANGHATASPLALQASHIEEFVFTAEDTLYCACGRDGVWRSSPPYTQWHHFSEGQGIEQDGTVSWAAVAASAGGDVYAGAVDAPLGDTGLLHSLKRLPSGQNTWVDIPSDPADISTDVPGTDPPTRWWLADGSPANLLSHGNYDVAMLLAAPSGEGGDTLVVAGRGGVWRSDDSGTHWAPYVRDLGVAVGRGVRASPKDAGRLYIGAQDWNFFYSTDRGTHVTRLDLPTDLETTSAYAVALDERDAQPLDVFLAAGGRENMNGEVYENDDPPNQSWRPTGLEARTSDPASPCPDTAKGGHPLGLSIGRDASRAQVIIAAVNGCGVWRRTLGMGWRQAGQQTLLLGDQGGINQAPVVWPDWPSTNDPYVYVLDRYQGALFRSNNYGSPGSWCRIWADIPGLGPGSAWVGYIAADPLVQGRLWLTTGERDGTYLITNADTTSCNGTPSSTKYLAPVYPGPIAVKPNTSVVYVATDPSELAPELWRSPAPFSSWTPLADDTYKAAVIVPLDISVTPGLSNAVVYVGTAGQGVLRISPA
jgi:hypothetical protein